MSEPALRDVVAQVYRNAFDRPKEFSVTVGKWEGRAIQTSNSPANKIITSIYELTLRTAADRMDCINYKITIEDALGNRESGDYFALNVQQVRRALSRCQ